MKIAFLSFLLLMTVAPVLAHDTWVEANTNIIRAGDAVHIDLKLGNHGNDHRDFKLAGKADLDACTLDVIAPDGNRLAVKDLLVDLGYAPKEGYWSTKFAATKPGLYAVAHQMDKVVNHGRPVRAIKSGKTFFVVSSSLDRVPLLNPGFDRPLGHALEIVPVINPVTPMGPGMLIDVRVLLKGKPMANARVSFIPRGHVLKSGYDETYERKTGSDGRATFTPTTGNSYLVVTHHKAEKESGKDYEQTDYSATLVVFVPEKCPCCGD
jgi:uncharacterized GH25 family protein